jgi:hypothetical protein
MYTNEYKDSVFSLLFNDRARLLELYNALNGTSYTDNDGIAITPLQNTASNAGNLPVEFAKKSFRRPSAWTFVLQNSEDNCAAVIQYQSKLNISRDLPLNILLQLTDIYYKVRCGKGFKGDGNIRPSRTVFTVLCNKYGDSLDKRGLKYSQESYDKNTGITTTGFEMTAKVYNINKGMNPDIEKRCPTLSGYAELVGRVRKDLKAGINRAEAVKGAVHYCKAKGILEDFFKEHVSEVESMPADEWDITETLRPRAEII